MRLLPLLLLSLFLSLSSRAEETRVSFANWLEKARADVESGKPANITTLPSPAKKDLKAVYIETEQQWWGSLHVVKCAADTVEWEATMPHDYVEGRGHYVAAFRWIKLSSTGNPVLEIRESTHMGNGSLWLLELVGKELRVILQAPARGRLFGGPPDIKIPEFGEARFKGDLKVKYTPGGKKQPEMVTLSGTVAIVDGQDNPLADQPYTRRWSWDTGKRAFKAESP